jgi:hypothetical protein
MEKVLIAAGILLIALAILAYSYCQFMQVIQIAAGA